MSYMQKYMTLQCSIVLLTENLAHMGGFFMLLAINVCLVLFFFGGGGGRMSY